MVRNFTTWGSYNFLILFLITSFIMILSSCKTIIAKETTAETTKNITTITETVPTVKEEKVETTTATETEISIDESQQIKNYFSNFNIEGNTINFPNEEDLKSFYYDLKTSQIEWRRIFLVYNSATDTSIDI